MEMYQENNLQKALKNSFLDKLTFRIDKETREDYERLIQEDGFNELATHLRYLVKNYVRARKEAKTFITV